MFNFLNEIKKLLTGEAVDEECQRYVESHNPKTTADVERLQEAFWRGKARNYGYFQHTER
jgi:hypothetical protein